VNKQDHLITWIYDHRETLPLKPGSLYNSYSDDQGYDASQAAFSQLTRKLLEKGHLEKPDGEFDITDKGVRYSQSILTEDEDMVPEDWQDVSTDLETFLLEEKEDAVHNAQVRGEKVEIGVSEVERFKAELVDDYLCSDADMFCDFLGEALDNVCQPDSAPGFRIKPDVDWLEKDLPEAITASNLGEVAIVEGVIRKREQVLKSVESATFECQQCVAKKEKEQTGDSLKSPFKCDECGGKNFQPVTKEVVDVINLELTHRDKQEIRLSTKITGSPDIPHDMSSELMTGARVRIIGTVELNSGTEVDEQMTYLDVIDFERSDKTRSVEDISDELKNEVIAKINASDDAFDDFAKSIAPELGDMNLPKKAFTASLISAPRVKDEDGRLHSCVISNPGTGKSNLQEWVNEHFDKTHRADGGTGTGTGLTATVEQQNGGGWQLVAGPLVFADGGFLQIDEFDKFAEGELAQLNTAMESGVLPVSKASINAELPAEATVMATGNFQGKLSNFDAAYEMLPEKGEGLYDRFALMCAVTESGEEAEEKLAAYYMDNGELSDEQQALFQTPFSPNELRVFRHLAQKHKPLLTPEVRDVLQSYKHAAEEMDEGLKGSSNRMFKHLIQLSQAVARSNLRDTVTVEDAEKAKRLKRKCRDSLDLDLGEDPATQLERTNKLKAVREAADSLDAGDGPVDVDKLQDESGLGTAEFEDALQTLKDQGEIEQIGSDEVIEA